MISASSRAASSRVPTPASGSVIVTCSGVVMRTASGVSAVVAWGGSHTPSAPFPTGAEGAMRESSIMTCTL